MLNPSLPLPDVYQMWWGILIPYVLLLWEVKVSPCCSPTSKIERGLVVSFALGLSPK
jgi:hypothetical protein